MADQRAHSITEGRDVLFKDTGAGRALAVSLQGGGSVSMGDVNVLSMPAVASGIKLSPEGRTKTITAAGTAEPLDNDAGTYQMMLYVRAKTTNTGNIYFGSSTVDKTSSKQIILTAGQAVTVAAPGGYCIDLNEFYFDADVTGEGIDYLCL